MGDELSSYFEVLESAFTGITCSAPTINKFSRYSCTSKYEYNDLCRRTKAPTDRFGPKFRSTTSTAVVLDAARVDHAFDH